MPASSSAANRVPGILFSRALAPQLDSDLHPALKPQQRRRVRSPALPRAAAGARPRRCGAASGGRRSGPATPLLRWKFSEKPPSEPGRKVEDVRPGVPPPPTRISARKLAAGIWHLRPLGADGSGRHGGGEKRRAPLGPELVPGYQEVQLFYNPLSTDLHVNKNRKNGHASPVSVLSPKYGDFHKVIHYSYKFLDFLPFSFSPFTVTLIDATHLERSVGFQSSAMEKATKWDPGSSMTTEEVYRFYRHLKLLEDQELNTVSTVSSLRTELERARARISELERERKLAKKKLDQFLNRLAEEKESWRSREHEKFRAIIEAMKADLGKERKKRQRTEIIHAKLVSELAEAKLTAKQLLQDYEKERKARELVEEVCDELAKEIGEDKAEIESLKMEAMKIQEEAEDEKKMLQMAEVWREERVQMKLIDAKLTLEEKYSELRDLKAELEAFLSARMTKESDFASMKEAELLKGKADLVNIEVTKEFSYQPPLASEDIYAVVEELQPKQETNARDIKPCCVYSPRSHASKVNTVSPGTDGFLEHPTKQHAHEMIDSNDDEEDESDWETVSQAEEQGSSNSHDGSEPSVNDYCKESYASVSETELKENGNKKLNNEIIEVSPTNAKSRKKVSSICRLWRSSAHDNVEDHKKRSLSNGRISTGTLASNDCEEYKKLSVEYTNGRPDGRISNGNLSPDMGLGEAGLSPGSIGHLNSPDLLNSHITRGMKGCIEWPRSDQKHGLKAKLLEARMGSQKIQLRHVLKQKT
ncbi:hypothetical protein BHE74_00041616 [Ensete ventricosum]|nr:hypothetical protein GW17_00031838 [Ensete ventricosum]RWW51995.1 hypothetical protein BHE74_00041616 [Ensete ventricosum]